MQAGRKRRESELDNNETVDSSGVRRRITRACDQCNSLRTKCDGKQPCAHCVSNQLACEYARAYKKRGRAPKKDQEQNEEELEHTSHTGADIASKAQSGPIDVAPQVTCPSNSHTSQPPYGHSDTTGSEYTTPPQPAFYAGYPSNEALSIPGAADLRAVPDPIAPTTAVGFPGASSGEYPASSLDGLSCYGFSLGDDYSVAFMGKAPMVESPDWLALTSPMFINESLPTPPRPTETLRYPVLLPLLPHIDSIIPQPLACDLLEQYFTTSTSAYLRPKNPYILGCIFRKSSILHATKPRACSPALLASMLWASAQHSDAPFLTMHPDARGRTCQKLLELTIFMLKPLIHTHGLAVNQNVFSTSTNTDAGLGGLVYPSEQNGGVDATRLQIDNIATYIHLATVVSASERKAASLRWWNAAWSLAREIRLGRELPSDEQILGDSQPGWSMNRAQNGLVQLDQGKAPTSAASADAKPSCTAVTEEDREERRRVWWLLYMMDRHLSLCYNKPLVFLNKECENLLLPLDDDAWQAGRFETASSANRRRGLGIECTSHSVFGYFLPLMVILGEILDLNYSRNRPQIGARVQKTKDWDDATEQIVSYLEDYHKSVREFELSGTRWLNRRYSETTSPDPHKSEPYSVTEAALQTRTVVAYSEHIMHVLHVLLAGKWDPIALLDDHDLWISTQSFVTATGHAVCAAKSLAKIIEFDPDLSFMPFFFGIYLLQGSFLLLLFADKLQEDITSDVVKACETIVRAHEACVATLDTQYQRNFRKVMRSALQQLRGRMHEDSTEQQNWRREILKLYRWTGDGTGLAL